MKLENGVYNKSVFWPQELKTKIKETMKRKYKILPSVHAQEKIQKLKLPPSSYRIALYGEIIEAEIQNGNIIKIVTRMERKCDWCDYEQDICSVVVFNYPNATVKTMWLNAKGDNHATLHIENYICKNRF